MKRLLLPVLAFASAACAAGGAAPTQPTTVPAGPPEAWAGLARYSERWLDSDGSTGAWTFEGPVTWQKAASPDPATPAGAVRYGLAGSEMDVTYRAVVGVCTIVGATHLVLGPADKPQDPDLASFLVLNPDGSYKGYIHSEATVSWIRSCTGKRPVTGSTDPRMDLYIEGRLTDGRLMQGQMAPDSFANTTLTGSWDFAPR